MQSLRKIFSGSGTAIDTAAKLTAAAPHDPDSALLMAIAAGSIKAMEAFYRDHKVFVYRFIKRLIGDEHLAEDVVSDVFLEVWRHAGRFEGRSQVSTWLLGIARLKALSALRRIRRHRPTVGNEVIEHQDSKQMAAEGIDELVDTPEDELVRKEARTRMRVCVTQLSAKHREIIDLFYYQEKTVEEIAAIIHASRNTIKSRAFYARQQLAQLMQPNRKPGPASIQKAA